MPRRAHLDMLALSALVPRGDDAYWRLIREADGAGDGWTLTDIAGRTNVHRQTVRDFVARLVRGGFAEVIRHDRVGTPPVPAAVYRLIKAPLDTPRLRRDGTELPEPGNARLWRSIRMAKNFGGSDIAADAGADIRTVRRYLAELAGAGVIEATEPGGPGREAQYRLVRNLGPKAPKILRLHIVFDPNSGAVLGEPVAKEVRP